MELFKYVYFHVQKSIIKAGNNKFQDLINAPRILFNWLILQLSVKKVASSTPLCLSSIAKTMLPNLSAVRKEENIKSVREGNAMSVR